MQEAGQRRRHDPKTMISARTRNGKKRDGDDSINLRDSLMVNRRENGWHRKSLKSKTYANSWSASVVHTRALVDICGIYCLMSHTDQTEEELASRCPLEVITQKSIGKTPFPAYILAWSLYCSRLSAHNLNCQSPNSIIA